MSDDFDPYHEWLGIEPHERPVNHYRLLGIPVFTSDSEAIRSAADGRMNDIRKYQMGRRGAHTQPILNALSAAKLCLLNPNTKATYDAVLEAQARMPQRTAANRIVVNQPQAPENNTAPPLVDPPISEPPLHEPPREPAPIKAPPQEAIAPPPPPLSDPPLHEPPMPEPSRTISVDSEPLGSRHAGAFGGLVPLVVLVVFVAGAAIGWFAYSIAGSSPQTVAEQPSNGSPNGSPESAASTENNGPTENIAPLPIEDASPPATGDPANPALPVVVQQEGGGQVQFRPAAAMLAGEARLANTGSGDVIVGWASDKDRAVWQFRVTQPGQFRLRLEYASPVNENLGNYRVVIADRDIKRTVRGGGTNASPVADEVAVALPRGGDYRLELIPVTVPGEELFGLHSIELRLIRGGQ